MSSHHRTQMQHDTILQWHATLLEEQMPNQCRPEWIAAAADSPAHGMAGSVINMLERITGRSKANSAVSDSGGKVSLELQHDVETGLSSGAAVAAVNGKGSGNGEGGGGGNRGDGSTPGTGDVRGPEGGAGRERVK